MIPPRLLPTLLIVLLVLPRSIFADEPSAQQLDFFEKHIRPILVQRCYECHSVGAKKLQGGLLLDSRQGMQKGGDTGRAVVPKNVGESLLISALKYQDFEMPPKGKLPQNVINDFVKWIEMGAPDPRDGPATVEARTIDLAEGRQHWSYQPLKDSTPPMVSNTTWSNNTIDQFILEKLERHRLQPAADADPEILVRRVYYDLTGLPPTPEEIDEYLQSAIHNPNSAFEQLVDRLLASPRFGERWGRHWLDVVRFGESNTLRGTVFSQAWRFRDYVIDSFNDDLPFDRFILEQVAGDLLPSDSWQEERRQRIATGMLSLGNTNFENQDKGQLRMDAVDEQLDVISLAFLGQTITCARCHDHKFDPIPTRDYYALAGILRNTKTLEHSNVSRWLEVPLPSDPATEAKLAQDEAAIKNLEQQIAALKKPRGAQVAATTVTGPKSVAVKSLDGIVVDNTEASVQGNWVNSQYTARFVEDGYLHDADAGKGEKSVSFEVQLPADGDYEVRMSYTAGTNRAANTPVSVWSVGGEKVVRVNQKLSPPIDGMFISLGTFSFRSADAAIVVITNKGTNGHVIVDGVQFLNASELAKQPAAKTAQEKQPAKEKPTPDADSQSELKSLETELKKLRESASLRELAMSIVEEKEINDTHIHIRGNVHSLGTEVPRGFLQVVSNGPTATFTDGESGRQQLGQWLSSNDNPLTARVIVNRLWHWLFGTGLVRTTDNFGTVGESPSHPELLDFLAIQLQREGWSVKSMLRQMVLSRTYRMSSHVTEPARTVVRSASPNPDVENRLLWRMNRRRIEAESIRDTMLAVAGQLQLSMHGPTFPSNQTADYDFQYKGLRRSVYAPVFRNSLLEVFEVFDFANPSVVVGRRSVSIVAPQALFMMNNPNVIEQSRQAAERLWKELPASSYTERIERAYRYALGRRPKSTELQLASRFLADVNESSRVEAWGEFYQALFASLDFRYVD